MSFTGTRFSVSDGQIQKWQHVYRDVNVEQELRFMAEYLETHPRKRYKRYGAFIVNWLKGEQRKAVERKREAMVGRGPEAGGKMKPEVLERVLATRRK